MSPRIETVFLQGVDVNDGNSLRDVIKVWLDKDDPTDPSNFSYKGL